MLLGKNNQIKITRNISSIIGCCFYRYKTSNIVIIVTLTPNMLHSLQCFFCFFSKIIFVIVSQPTVNWAGQLLTDNNCCSYALSSFLRYFTFQVNLLHLHWYCLWIFLYFVVLFGCFIAALGCYVKLVFNFYSAASVEQFSLPFLFFLIFLYVNLTTVHFRTNIEWLNRHVKLTLGLHKLHKGGDQPLTASTSLWFLAKKAALG